MQAYNYKNSMLGGILSLILEISLSSLMIWFLVRSREMLHMNLSSMFTVIRNSIKAGDNNLFSPWSSIVTTGNFFIVQ